MPTPTPPATALLNLAGSHLLAGKHAEAEVLLRQLIAAHPECAAGHHALGLIAFEAGNAILAIELIVKAITIDPLAGLYHRNLGELCRRMGRLDEAILAGRKASELTPQDVDTHFNLGLALADQGHWLEAIRAYKAAITLRADHGLSWNNLGAVLERSGQKSEALAAYAEAVRLNPGHAEAQLNLGLLYRQAGLLDQAAACFELARRSAPDLYEKHAAAVNREIAAIFPPQIAMRDTQSKRGRGVFADRDFVAGEIVETAAVVLLQSDFASLPQEIKSIVFNWGALCGIGDMHAIALGYGSLYNHASPASLRYQPDPANLALQFIATRDVHAGEELTVNYDNPQGSSGELGNDWFSRLGIARIDA